MNRESQFPENPGEILEVDWPLFGELCRGLALRIAADYDPEIVVGIAKAGVIPAAIVAAMLDRDFTSIAVTRYPGERRPTLITEAPVHLVGHRILIVDETCDSGDTLKLAINASRRREPAEIRTAVSIKTGDYEPDYYALNTTGTIILPWDHEVF